MKAQSPTKVIFRRDSSGVTAVFPTLPGTNDPSTFTVYAHLGQHASGSYGWYRTTKRAKPAEYADLARELRRIGYQLRVGQRFTRKDDEIRAARIN